MGRKGEDKDTEEKGNNASERKGWDLVALGLLEEERSSGPSV